MIHILGRICACRISRVEVISPSSIGSLRVRSNGSCYALMAYAPCKVGSRQLLIENREIRGIRVARAIHIVTSTARVRPLVVTPVITVPVLVTFALCMMFGPIGGRPSGRRRW